MNFDILHDHVGQIDILGFFGRPKSQKADKLKRPQNLAEC